MSSHAQAKGTTRAVAVARASTGLTTHRPAGSRVRAWCQGSRDPSAGRDREARGDRLVLGCDACPATRPSKRRPPRWGSIARGPQHRTRSRSSSTRRRVQGFLHGADIEAMHYHAWLRSGRVFTMSSRRFEIQSTAHRWAAGQRPEKGDRLVLGCDACPATRPSKRRPPRWGSIARGLAARFDWPASEVREALAAELAADRDLSVTTTVTALQNVVD